MEPIGDRLLGHKHLRFVIQRQRFGISFKEMAVKHVYDRLLRRKIRILIGGRDRGEVTHIEYRIDLYRLRLIVDGLIVLDRECRFKIDRLDLLLKGQGHKGACLIAFPDAVPIRKQRIRAVPLTCLDDVIGGKCSVLERHQLQRIDVKVNRVLDAPDTGVSVEAERDVEVILVLRSLNVDVALNCVVVSIHALGNHCRCGERDVKGLLPGVTACRRGAVKAQRCRCGNRGDTVADHRLVEPCAVDGDGIDTTAEVLRVVVSVDRGVRAGDGQRGRTVVGITVVVAVRGPIRKVIHDLTVVGVGIFAV